MVKTKYIYGLDDIIQFGKYEGDSIREIINEDPSYLAWAVDNIDWFNLTYKADLALGDAIRWQEMAKMEEANDRYDYGALGDIF